MALSFSAFVVTDRAPADDSRPLALHPTVNRLDGEEGLLVSGAWAGKGHEICEFQGYLKNSPILGAAAAAPGNELTPSVESTKRSVDSCW